MATVLIKTNIGQTKTTYQVYFKEPSTGKKKYYKSFPRKKDAQIAANDLRVLLDSGQTPTKKRRKLSALTFAQVATSLQAEWDEKLLKGILVKKTRDDYCYWLNVLVSEFGSSLLCQLSTEDVQGFVDKQILKNSKVSSNKYLSIFKKIFRHGIKIGALSTNPIEHLKKLSEKDHERKRFLLPDELDCLIAATQKNRARFYMPSIIFLGAEHGASKQEILSLKWSDINFDFEGYGIIRFFRTKNKNERIEYLMPRSKKALLEWRGHLEKKRKRLRITEIKSEHVFTRVDGTPLKSFIKAWHAILRKAKIKDFHFHDLRHTFCSNLILSGAGLKEAKEMIGHKDISMTDRYSHLTLKHKLAHQKRLAQFYENSGTEDDLV